jgi:hypothetical protein
MHLLVQDITEDAQMVNRKFQRGARRGRSYKVKVLKKTPHFELQPPFKDVKLWPAWLSVFGQILSLTISTSEMIEKLTNAESSGNEKVIAVAKVGKDAFELVDGLSAVLHASFPYAEDTGMIVKFAKVGEKFKGPGLVLEAILNVQEGAAILILDEDSLSASAVQREDYFEANVQEVRGLILVSSAVPGAVAAGSALLAGETAAAALGAAIPPLGLVLAIAGLAVIVADIVIYYHHGPTNVMDDVDKALVKAKVHEFGETFDKERTVESLQRFSKTVNRLIVQNAPEAAW